MKNELKAIKCPKCNSSLVVYLESIITGTPRIKDGKMVFLEKEIKFNGVTDDGHSIECSSCDFEISRDGLIKATDWRTNEKIKKIEDLFKSFNIV